ncbi:MAG: PD40 domain-containing protein [Gemmatimonadota bacterium]|nr:MAG: PD40 domain-containing protein [Gemmatimonadota bacterium]
MTGKGVPTSQRCGAAVVLLALLLVPRAFPASLSAQDPVDRGVRLGITYTPGMRPGMLVLGGPHRERLDSVRTIIQRDLEFSDRFEMIYLPGGDSLILGVGPAPDAGGSQTTAEVFVNYSLYAALGADYAVSVLEEYDSTLVVNLYDVAGEGVRTSVRIDTLEVHSSAFRMAAHRASDAIVRSATGEPGYAASRVLFVSRGRLYSVDSDGANTHVVSPADVETFSPAWAPDARRFAYTELTEDGWGSIVVQDWAAGRRSTVTPTTEYLNLSADFSPDGDIVVFSRGWDEGTQLFSYNLTQDCCLQRLTVGRLSDNLSPAFSPDGRRIAFESNRVGLAQIYIMSADGTDQELFAPYDYGVTGDSHSPAWSPDGLDLAFHRTVAGSPQIFVMDVRSRSVRQLTSAGRNEDPTWAPDGRHLAYKSSRTGAEQIWVIDIETGRVRQLTRLGQTRMPSWSPSITELNQP